MDIKYEPTQTQTCRRRKTKTEKKSSSRPGGGGAIPKDRKEVRNKEQAANISLPWLEFVVVFIAIRLLAEASVYNLGRVSSDDNYRVQSR